MSNKSKTAEQINKQKMGEIKLPKGFGEVGGFDIKLPWECPKCGGTMVNKKDLISREQIRQEIIREIEKHSFEGSQFYQARYRYMNESWWQQFKEEFGVK